MTTHKFNCLKCKLNFSFDSDKSDIKEAIKDIPARCPKCLDIWGEKGSNIEHQFVLPSMQRTMEIRRKDNIEATKYAKMQAAQYAATQTPEREKSITLEGKTEVVPERVIENINQKLIDSNKL